MHSTSPSSPSALIRSWLKSCGAAPIADTLPRPLWHKHKQAYIDHLAHADADVLLVSAVDKLLNARAICSDLKLHGPAVFNRFKGGLEGTLWFYESLLDVFRWRIPGPLTGGVVTVSHQTGT